MGKDSPEQAPESALSMPGKYELLWKHKNSLVTNKFSISIIRDIPHSVLAQYAQIS